jgi:hypothetical protein
MSITDRAQKVLAEIDAALALADNAHGDAPPDYTYCQGLSDYYEAATNDSGWPASLRCLKTAIKGLEAAHAALPDGDDTAWNALAAILDTWEATQ